MKRYRFLRRLGCGFITAAFIAVLNEAFNTPSNEIRFMTLIIEMD